MSTIGQRIAAEMVRLELSEHILAQKANVRPGQLREVLLGQNTDPSTRLVMSVARVLGVSEAYLREGNGAAGLHARAPFCALVALLEAMTPQKQDTLCTIFAQTIHAARRNPRILEPR